MILFSNLGTEELQCSVNTSFTLYLYWTSTCRNFFLQIIIFVVLASLVPKRSIMRYLRCHLGFSGFGILVLLAFFKGTGIFWPFGILAYFLHLGILTILASLAFLTFWHLEIKKDIIKYQSCLDFGIFSLYAVFF